MENNMDKIYNYIKENIPKAEILEVSHTEKIFSENACIPKMKGLLILIKD